MRWFLAGLGYTAREVALQLRTKGVEIAGCGRGPNVSQWRDIGVQAIASDMSRLFDTQLACDVAVIFVPPSKPVTLAETQIAQRFVAAGAQQLIYVSSTGVYAAGSGALVDETWPTRPLSATGEARLAVEQALLATVRDIAAATTAPPPRLAIARVAGIYGPGRAPWDKVKAGEYRLIDGGTTAVSRIHVTDLARAIVALGQHGGNGIYNVADDDPASAKEVVDAVCAATPCPAPPELAAADVPSEVSAMLLADRRIDASKLKADAHWTPHYPSWRDAWRTALLG
ncbi:MAG: NAD-dependent epimerase/dehydratase family protein [Myxococcales bacterium]|nr:NAD-dependent epimerase/dehydratase family protein [Myxococcales bacterium]